MNPNPTIEMEHAHKDGIGKLATLLERSILTLRALPDNERRFLYVVENSWPDILSDPSTGYGYTDIRPPKFEPLPYDVQNYLTVLDWFTWLENQNNGKRDAQIITARAYNTPWWRLASQFSRDQRTVKRWYEGAVTAIYGRFYDKIWET